MKVNNHCPSSTDKLVFSFSGHQTNFHSSSTVLFVLWPIFSHVEIYYLHFGYGNNQWKMQTFLIQSRCWSRWEAVCSIINERSTFELFTNCSTFDTICKRTEGIINCKPNQLMLCFCLKQGHHTPYVLCPITMTSDWQKRSRERGIIFYMLISGYYHISM